MVVGDLIRYEGPGADFQGARFLGILLRKLQYETDDPIGNNWDGKPAWWVQFINDPRPTWSYETEMTLVGKGN